jgi:hypothetical protein
MDRLDYFAGLAMRQLIENEASELIMSIPMQAFMMATAMVAESDLIKAAQKKGSANGKV